MRKMALVVSAIAAVTAMAGVVDPFIQFSRYDENGTGNDVGYYYGTLRDQGGWDIKQAWGSAQLIKMHVASNSYVYLTNFVDNWQDKENGIPDLNTVYNMTPGSYGYINVEDLPSLTLEKSKYSPDVVNFATGGTTQVTYFDDEDPTNTVTTTGYLLAYFEEEKDIYLAMTPLDTSELLDSYQYVTDPAHEATVLASRQYNTNDLAGNVRINFGLADADPSGREFVAVYAQPDDNHNGTSGQPLPGLLLATVLSAGSIAAGKRMKKRA